MPAIHQRLAKLLAKCFRLEQWGIGWAQADIMEFIDQPQSIFFQWFAPRDPRTFLADPFIVRIQGRPFILAEKLVRGSHGQIVLMDPEDPEKERLLLSKRWHLSYPFIVRDGDTQWIVPEQGASNSVGFYRWEADGRLSEEASHGLPDCDALDSTFLFHEGRWWMFSTRMHGASPHGPLLLHFANRLTGPYEPHPANPIQTDLARSRPAGRIISRNGRLIRPAQDCSGTYGAAIVLNEITRLTPEAYEEQVIARIEPKHIQGAFPDGSHHIDHAEGWIVIDSKRFVWHPLAWWYKFKSRRGCAGRAGRSA